MKVKYGLAFVGLLVGYKALEGCSEQRHVSPWSLPPEARWERPVPSPQTTRTAEFQPFGWRRTIQIGGSSFSYWDYYSCFSRNFSRSLTAQASRSIVGGDVRALLASEDNYTSSVGRGIAMISSIMKLACAAEWDWNLIRSDLRFLSESPIAGIEILPRGPNGGHSTDMIAAVYPPDIANLFSLGVFLQTAHLIKSCQSMQSLRICVSINSQLADSTEKDRIIADANWISDSKSYRASTGVPRRSLIQTEPRIYGYFEDDHLVTAVGIRSALFPALGFSYVSGMISEELDGEIPTSFDQIFDVFRYVIAIFLGSGLEAREVLARENPAEYENLSSLSIIMRRDIPSLACSSYVHRESRAVFCPGDGVVFVAPDPQHVNLARHEPEWFLRRVEATVARMYHELSHYIFDRRSWRNVPFLNEGLATAYGERLYRIAAGAIEYGRLNPEGQRLALKIARAEVLSQQERDALSRAELDFLSASNITPNQLRFTCILLRHGFTANDLERHMKEEVPDTDTDMSTIYYARAWAIFESILDTGDGDRLLFSIAELSRIQRAFNTVVTPDEVSAARQTLVQEAERALTYARSMAAANGLNDCTQ